MISVKIQDGIHVEAGEKYILADPTSRPVGAPDVVLISHAHSDHYSLSVLRSLRKSPIVMSKITRHVIDPHGRLRNVVEVEPGQEIEVAGVSIRAHEAGHIIGSLQFSFDLGNLSITYTGDFNASKRIVLRPAEIAKSDILLVDATYGSPLYDFPPRAQLYSRLVQEVREGIESSGKVLLRSRRFGVAQEITALLNLSMRIPPVVDEKIARYNSIYEDFGEFIGSYVSSPALENGRVIIAGLNARPRGAGKSITCTGWAVRKGVPLSSHSGFSEIVEYALKSGAAVVIPFVGFRKFLAEHLKSEHGMESFHGDRIVLRV